MLIFCDFRVNVLQGSPIYECNSKCNCGADCPNRVVQDGISDHKLSIFRTSNECGWGVKTLKVKILSVNLRFAFERCLKPFPLFYCSLSKKVAL